jgi:DNA-directed RNA polymerase specialized sigma24 family protein
VLLLCGEYRRSEPSGTMMPASEWLDSSYLSHVAHRVGYCYGIDKADLPDLEQEVRIALWQAGPGRTFNATWVFQTTIHKALDLLKVRRRLPRPSLGSSRYASADAELGHLLSARVSQLPRQLRMFLRLRFEEGLSEREISTRMRICRGSVRWMERRCVRLLGGPRHPSP